MVHTNESASPAKPIEANEPSILVQLSIQHSSVARLLSLFQETLEATFRKTVSESRISAETKPSESPESVPSSKSTGLDMKAMDKLKAADLRVAVLMGKIPEDTGLLIDPKTFARLLDISTSTLYRLQAEEALPASVEFGHIKKWRLAEVLEWIDANCPPRQEWTYRRENSFKRKGR